MPLVRVAIVWAFACGGVVIGKASLATDAWRPPLSAGVARPAGKSQEPQKKRKPKFTIGKATTYATGPVDPDGYIDYVVALNERLREGVTPENNAAALLWHAFGPHPEEAMISPEVFEWMRIEAPPQEGREFTTLAELRKDRKDT